VEKLDFYEKTCIQDRIDIDLALEKLAPSQDIAQDDEIGRSMVLDAKERVVTRLTMMMQELQREAVSMGPLVDSFTTALLDLILVAVNEELTPATNQESSSSSSNLSKIRESGDEKTSSESSLQAPMMTTPKKFAQAMSLSDSAALMETVMQIQNLEAVAMQQQQQQQQQQQAHHHHQTQLNRKSQWSGGEVDLDSLAADLRPSYLGEENTETPSTNKSKHSRRSVSQGGGSGGGGEYGGYANGEKKLNEAGELAMRIAREEESKKLAALEEQFKAKVAALEERMNIYKSIAPVPEDEMQWLIESKGQNAYLVAEKKEADTQAKYITFVEIYVSDNSIHLFFFFFFLPMI
jgi:hypothetical protein